MMYPRILISIAIFAYCCSTASAASPIPREYFGLVMHRVDSGSPWPPFVFGTWRIWDAHAGWPDLEPTRGQWDFKRLDLYVKAAEAKGVDVVYTLGLCAPWASARPTEPSGYKPGYAAEPANLKDWRNYVRTVAERYKGRIKYYEVWNEPSDKLYFTGRPELLVEIMRVAYETLKEVDPTIKVISPGFAGTGGHLRYFDQLLGLGAKNYLDIVGYHFYVQKSPPEAMLPIIRDVQKTMAKHGLSSKPLWNTETGWWISNGDGTPDHALVAKSGWRRLDASREAGAVMARALMLARAEGVGRFVWYSWDNYGMGMLEPTAKTPKPLARHYANIVTALEGWSVEQCSEQDRIWTCRLARAGERTRLAVWTSSDRARWAPPLQTTSVMTLENLHVQPHKGGTIEVDSFPVVVW